MMETIIDQLLQEIIKIILQNGLIKEINFYSNQTEKRKSQIFLFDLNNNSIQKLTNFQYSIESIQWSPNDKYILFSSFIDSERDTLIEMPDKPKGAKWNDPPVEVSDLNYQGMTQFKDLENLVGVQFFTIPVNGGTPRQISNIKPEKRAGQGVWLGNDKISFSANLNEDSDYNTNNSEIYVLGLDSGEHKALTSQEMVHKLQS